MRYREREKEREREREAETQAKGEAGSLQGARCGIPSWVSRIMPWAEGRHLTAEPPRDPFYFIFEKYQKAQLIGGKNVDNSTG